MTALPGEEAQESPVELVERVAKAIEVRQKQLFFDAASDHGDVPSAVYRELALAALEAIRPAELPESKPTAWRRLGEWTADKELGPVREWDWYRADNERVIVSLREYNHDMVPTTLKGEGPTLDDALAEAMEKVP